MHVKSFTPNGYIKHFLVWCVYFFIEAITTELIHLFEKVINYAFPPPLCFLYAYPSLPGPGKGEKLNLENVWQKQVWEAKTTTAQRMQLGITFWRDNNYLNSAAFIIKILQVFQEIESMTELWFCNWSNNNVNPFPPLFKCRTVSDCFAVFKSPLESFCPSQDKARNFRCSRKFSGIQPSFEF